MTPYGYRIVTNAGAWEGEALLLVAANTRYFGGGLDIAPRADPADGLLEIIRLDSVGRLGLLAHLARLRRGAHPMNLLKKSLSFAEFFMGVTG